MYTPSAKAAPLLAMLNSGKAEAARAQVARLLQKSTADPELCAAMAAALLDLGQKEQSAFYAGKAAAWAGGDAGKLGASGHLLAAFGLADAAADTFRRAVAGSPADAGARLNLLNHLFGVGRLVAAVEAGQEAIRACPQMPELHLVLAFALMGLGRPDQTQAVLAHAAAAFPDSLAIATARASSANYLENADPTAVFELHRDFGRLLQRTQPAAPVRFAQTLDPARRLRVAVISPDFRTHSIAYYIEALFAHADRAQVELIGVSTVAYEDQTTARLRSLAARTGSWRTWPGLPDHDLAARLRAEKIDIALDIAGHSFRHALGALHLRAAPVQATYMGYPNTTGVAAVDYRIVDAITDPPHPPHPPSPPSDSPNSPDSAADRLATERLVRLDGCFLCYTPPPDAPGAEPVPPSQRRGAGAPGGITFGSFNNLSKLNNRALRLWSRVLAAVPGSTLAVKNLSFADAGVQADFLARAVAAGIDPARLRLLPPGRATADHLRAYQEVDIALDSVPYNGTTTTCESLWMGVPVITLAGHTHASRVGLSLLSAVGLPELSGKDEAGYVSAAAALAADPARLADLRRTLRDRLRASPLCDGPAFAARFTAALRHMWHDRCRGAGT